MGNRSPPPSVSGGRGTAPQTPHPFFLIIIAGVWGPSRPPAGVWGRSPQEGGVNGYCHGNDGCEFLGVKSGRNEPPSPSFFSC